VKTQDAKKLAVSPTRSAGEKPDRNKCKRERRNAVATPAKGPNKNMTIITGISLKSIFKKLNAGMMGNAINCKTVPIAAHIAIVTIFLVLLFINTNPPKFRIPLQTNLLNFLDSLLVGARQSKKCPLFHREKEGI